MSKSATFFSFPVWEGEAQHPFGRESPFETIDFIYLFRFMCTPLILFYPMIVSFVEVEPDDLVELLFYRNIEEIHFYQKLIDLQTFHRFIRPEPWPR